jgi:hypothetical protein
MKNTIKGAKIIELAKMADDRGNLSFIEGFKEIPFEIKRVYWIHDVPGGEMRGGHSFKTQEEFIVALSGSFNVSLDDGECEANYLLSRSYYGLHVSSGIWREMNDFSTNSLALVLSSTSYSPNDYIYDRETFKKHILK